MLRRLFFACFETRSCGALLSTTGGRLAEAAHRRARLAGPAPGWAKTARPADSGQSHIPHPAGMKLCCRASSSRASRRALAERSSARLADGSLKPRIVEHDWRDLPQVG